MRLTCMSELLREGISAVENVAQTRISNPVAETVVIRAAGGRIEFFATDLSVDVKYWGDGDVEEDGEIAVPARVLQDLVKELYEEKTEVETTGQGVSIRCGAGKFTLQTLDPRDFPAFPVMEEGS